LRSVITVIPRFTPTEPWTGTAILDPTLAVLTAVNAGVVTEWSTQAAIANNAIPVWQILTTLLQMPAEPPANSPIAEMVLLILVKNVMIMILKTMTDAPAADLTAETESSKGLKPVMMELPTAIPSPTDAERTVWFTTAVMVPLIPMRNVMMAQRDLRGAHQDVPGPSVVTESVKVMRSATLEMQTATMKLMAVPLSALLTSVVNPFRAGVLISIPSFLPVLWEPSPMLVL